MHSKCPTFQSPWTSLLKSISGISTTMVSFPPEVDVGWLVTGILTIGVDAEILCPPVIKIKKIKATTTKGISESYLIPICKNVFSQISHLKNRIDCCQVMIAHIAVASLSCLILHIMQTLAFRLPVLWHLVCE